MPVHRLDDQQAAVLRAQPLSYPADRRLLHDAPTGFRHLERSRVLARQDFDSAADDLLNWRVHDWAGLRVQASDIPLRAGTVVLMRWGLGPLSVRIPCRVLEVVDEPGRRGFAYGTLPGHPETGEESFLLEGLDDDSIRFTIVAVSRPASALASIGGPATRAVQKLMLDRYLQALDHR